MTQLIHGAYAPVPTPVRQDGSFDEDALARHLCWLATEGLDGAVVLGTNGEFPSFTLAERIRIAECAAAADSGLRLLLGVGSCAVGEAEEMVDLAGRMGYWGALCPPPFYFRSAPIGGLAAFLKRVLAAAEIPVLLYHIPQITGVAISDRLLDELYGSPHLAGVKDSTGDPLEMDRLLGWFAGDSYLVGSDRLISRCLTEGGSGSITAAASVVPGLVAGLRSQPSKQSALEQVRGLLEKFGLAAAVKSILRRMGIGDYASRPPMMELSAEEADVLASMFADLTGAPLKPG